MVFNKCFSRPSLDRSGKKCCYLRCISNDQLRLPLSGQKANLRLHLVHGGCIATLFDTTTTAALLPNSKPGFWSAAGVSRTLNVTYLRPVPVGTTVIIENEVTHAGKRLSKSP